MTGTVRRFIAARLDTQAALGLWFTVALAIAVVTTIAFGNILEDVLENAALVRWDVATASAMHEQTNAFGLKLAFAISQLGSPVTITLISLVGIVLLYRSHSRVLLAAWIAAYGGSPILNEVIKLSVHRERPGYGWAYLFGHSYSFPSGHSMSSMVAYVMLAYVLVTRARLSWPPRSVIIGLAAVIILAVGASRIYLGVHYPSDVLGGFAAGAAWVSLCIAVAGAFHRRANIRRATRRQSYQGAIESS